jgi:uncharacterized protein YlxP (DUF503 family)
MVVGVATFTVFMPAVGSLKGKRSILNSVKGRVRARFNASIAEVDDLDLWQKSTLGVAVVSNDRRHVNSILEKIRATVEREDRLDLLDYTIEID